MANRFNTETHVPVAGGGTYAVNIDSGVTNVIIRPAAPITISADVNITVSGTPKLNQYIKFLYAGTITSNVASGYTVNIFGTSLTDAQALYEAEITALYNGSTWEVKIFPSREGAANLNGAELVAGSVATAAIADNAITNDKLNSISRGYVKVGGASDAPTDLNASGDGKILVGDGTDLNSVTVSGAITLSNTGVATIPSGYVTTEMLATPPMTYYQYTGSISSANILDMCIATGGSGVIVIPAPGAGKLIDLISVSGFLDYNSITYAGGGTIELKYDEDAAGISIATATASAITGSADTISQFTLPGLVNTVGINAPIYLQNATAPFTTGNSPFKLSIVYRIIDFN